MSLIRFSRGFGIEDVEKHGQEHRSRIRRWCKYSILWTSIMGSMSVYSIFGSWSFSWNESLICDFALKLMLLREDKWGTRLPSVLSWLHVLTGFKCSRERIFLSMTPGSYIKEQKKWETDLPVRLLELAIKVFALWQLIRWNYLKSVLVLHVLRAEGDLILI